MSTNARRDRTDLFLFLPPFPMGVADWACALVVVGWVNGAGMLLQIRVDQEVCVALVKSWGG